MKKVAVLFVIGLVLAVCAFKVPHKAKSGKLPALVRLHAVDTGDFFCSGVVVGPHRILTAAHCVVHQAEMPFLPPALTALVNVRSFDGVDQKIVAIVEGVNPRMDQAVLSGDFSAFDTKPVEIHTAAIEEAFMKGHRIEACGFPLAGEPVCSEITKVHRMAFQFAAEGFLFPGMSGGPVVDMDTGEVIGVNTAVQENGEVILSSTVEMWSSCSVEPLVQ